LQRWQRYGFGKDPPVSAQEFAELKQSLSPTLRERMEKQGGEMAAQWEALTAAVAPENRAGAIGDARRSAQAGAAQQQALLAMFLRQLSDPSLEYVGEQELWTFFHKLPREERDRIKRLPREESVQQLRALNRATLAALSLAEVRVAMISAVRHGQTVLEAKDQAVAARVDQDPGRQRIGHPTAHLPPCRGFCLTYRY